MSGLPRRPAVEPPGTERVAALTEAGDAVEALASATARAVLDRLSRAPAPVSAVAAALDTTIQTVRYHVERLRDAGVVERVGTWYSAKGREMAVYGAASLTLYCRPADRTAGEPAAVPPSAGGAGADAGAPD